MLQLYDLYNVGMIFIYVDKSHCQTQSHSCIEGKQRCLPNLNEEYTGQCWDDTDLHVNINASKRGDEAYCPPGSQQDTDLMY